MLGNIESLRDFNAQTKDEQTTMFEAMCGEVMAEEDNLKPQAQDMSEVTKYGKHF